MNTTHRPLSSRSRPLFHLVALAACLLSAASLQAGTLANDTPQVVVKYSDLNLATDDGAVALHRRIAAAAREVCPSELGRDLSRLALVHECQQAAIARAVVAIHSERLAAVHAKSAGRG
jgi:UrcA family protein